MITIPCLTKFKCLCRNSIFLQPPEEQQRGVRRAVHQPSGVPDSGGQEAEQGRRWLPHQHPVAEELLAPGLKTMFLL